MRKLLIIYSFFVYSLINRKCQTQLESCQKQSGYLCYVKKPFFVIHIYIHTYFQSFCLFQGQFEDPCPRKTWTILFIITYEHYSYKLNSVYSFGGFPVQLSNEIISLVVQVAQISLILPLKESASFDFPFLFLFSLSNLTIK